MFTVAVIQSNPEVSIVADPDTIHIGESAVLTWTSQYADACAIDQGIGSVAESGNITVTPTETTIYTVTAESATGQATASATVTVIPIGISITSPLANDTITRPVVMVEGTITNPLDNEVGVTINGVPALVDGDTFVTNHVPLEEGENILTAVATDADGNSAGASVTVNLSPAEHYIRITVDAESGVSPFETTLKVDGSFTFIAQTPTYTGPGTVEIVNSTEENEFIVNITTPGIYYFTSQIEFEGETYSDAFVVSVMDEAELDALLQAKWDGLKSALIAGDMEKALTYHHAASHEAYSLIYSLPAIDMQNLAQQMQDIEMVIEYGDMAQYRIKRKQTINGQQMEITYYIYFSKNNKGLWMIESY